MTLKPDNFIIAFIVFAVFIVGGSLFISDVNTSYNKTIGTESEFSVILAKTNSSISDINDQSKTAANKVIGGNSSKISDTDALDFLLTGAFSAMKTVGTILSLGFTLPAIIGTAIGIPPVFTSMLYIILVTGIIWGLIYLILRVWPK